MLLDHLSRGWFQSPPSVPVVVTNEAELIPGSPYSASFYHCWLATLS